MSEYSEFGSQEQAGWSDGGIVEAYVTHFVPITDGVGRHILNNHIAPGDRVLDLCCGQGSLTAALAGRCAHVVGLDFSPKMLAKARVAAPEAELVEGDAMAMPFDDATFDKVICNFGMMHIPDQPRALSEISRVLKPGGSFVMATWVGPGDSPAFAAVFGALRAHADFSAAPAQPDLFTFASRDQAEALMAPQGLQMTGHQTVQAEWKLGKPSELFDIFLTATVGAGMLIRSQSDTALERIAGAISETVEARFRDGDLYRVPVPVAVIAAKAA